MFHNFIYFIVALITLILYQPTQTPALSALDALLGLLVVTGLFTAIVRFRFDRLARRASHYSQRVLDQRFGQLMSQHAILALAVFAVVIWVLDLPSHIGFLGIFVWLPTLKDLLFLLLFGGYLVLVWTYAYDAHQAIYGGDLTRANYVYSNAAFSAPILLPWTLLFGISDLLRLLPFELPTRILDSAVGQTAYFLVFLVLATIFAPLLIKRIWRCRPLEAGDLRHRIEALCRQAGVRYADIVYWPIFGGRMITAGVMGLMGRFRYILVTDALLQMLSPSEVEQVIAHEIGHVKRKHLLLYLLFLVGFMLISYAAYPLSFIALFFVKPVLSIVLHFNLNPTNFIYAIYAVLLVAGVIVYFRYIFGYFIRNFERQADLFVFRMFRDPQPLIVTFQKIAATSGQPADKPNWHHFSIQERMDYLQRCRHDPHLIARHDRKLRYSIALFLTAFLLLAVGVFQLNQAVIGHGGRQLRLAALENYLERKTPKTEEDALLYAMLGNTHLERNDERAALSAYEKAARLNPNDPDILNNLAWVLATIEEPSLRKPQRALHLAQQAIALQSTAPHIWDTLAETLYANNRIEEAINAQQTALSLNPPDRTHYETQLEKFRQAKKRQE
ncbi:M48 family metallopeptidase [Desulfatitalea alkaliphila]|uniref:M48 family metalloprotease n=1 Tax=Desulfatitalea alkaliphila TaxID=2929485 RepID=A0AA41R2J1_9BACT|nr:M48 family metallopeptidase [Desulfatitalea alkaliphila]MCJ8500496.1 M48 family metalloprotease [Desulfatitalea alkaliphila]